MNDLLVFAGYLGEKIAKRDTHADTGIARRAEEVVVYKKKEGCIAEDKTALQKREGVYIHWCLCWESIQFMS